MNNSNKSTFTIAGIVCGGSFLLLGIAFLFVGFLFANQRMRPGPVPFFALAAFCFLVATAFLYHRGRLVTMPLILLAIIAAIWVAAPEFAFGAVASVGGIGGAFVLAIFVLYLYLRWKNRVSAKALKLARAGDVEGAISLMQDHLDHNGQSAAVYSDLAVLHAMRGNWPAVLGMIEEAERLGGQQPGFLNTKGLALWKSGQLTDALPCLEEAARRAPRDLLVACNYGSLLVELGHLDAAKLELQRAEQLFATGFVLTDAGTRQLRNKSLEEFRGKVADERKA
jgi:tetratricopeptide (TPR) repeat protein